MNTNSVSLLFFIKRTKVTKQENAPVYLKISQGTLSAEISTGISIPSSRWDVENKKVIGNDFETEELNDKLTLLRVAIKNIIKELGKSDFQISPQLVKQHYKANDSENEINVTLLDVCNDFLKREERRVNVSMAERTYLDMVQAKGKLVSYLNFINKPNILPVNFNAKMALDMQHWLLTGKPERGSTIGLSYVNRIMQFTKRMISHAVTLEIIPYNSLEHLDFKRKLVANYTSLEVDELELLRNAVAQTENEQKAIDLYVFNANTGLSYCDGQKLDCKEHLKYVGDVLCIEKLRHKNRFRKSKPDTFVPVNEIAYSILLKYNFVLPYLSTVTFNRNLKFVTERLGIKKRITTHTARKTFGDIAINHHKLPMELASMMLGHAGTEITYKLYARPKQTTVLEAMQKINKPYINHGTGNYKS